ncbi:MAG: DUF305 domain-containing protein [bacterium]|nr:DUF305 domain-containing protein [bacterium]
MEHQMKHEQDYGRLVLMILLSFIAMYALMYAMVNSMGNVLPNLNQFFMAGLMTAAMVIIELAVMRVMYQNKKLNAIIVTAGAAALILFWVGIRQQIGVSDQQFLRSMIPHHAGALLMCEQASLEDPELKELCASIAAG